MLDPVRNFIKVTVSTGYDAAATSIVLSAGLGALLPAPATEGAFNLVWFNSTDYTDPTDDPNVEVVRVTARTADTLTVTRAQEGTAASTKNTAGKTYTMLLTPTRKLVDDIATFMNRFRFGSNAIAAAGTTVAFTPAFPAGGNYIIGFFESPGVADPNETMSVKKTAIDKDGFTAEAYPSDADVTWIAINIG